MSFLTGVRGSIGLFTDEIDRRPSPELNATPMPIFRTLAYDGDMILVVGTGDQTIRLRVYSQYLKGSSSVFAAMLSPRWRPGRSLSDQVLEEIELPDDDPQAMHLICEILHPAKSKEQSDIPPAQDLFRMAITADKYDLCWALRLQVESWFRQDGTSSTQDRMNYLATASVMSIKLRDWTWLFDLVARHVGSYLPFLDDKALNAWLDHRVVCRLEEIRTMLRAKLLEAPAFGDCGGYCADGNLSFYDLECDFQSSIMAKNYILGHSAHEFIIFVKRMYIKEPSSSSYKLNEHADKIECQCGDITLRKIDDAYSETMSAVSSLLEERT